MTDRIIINQAIRNLAENGSEDALRTLYLAYYARLRSFVDYYVLSDVEAEEAISDTFLSIWMNRDHLNEIDNFYTYIFKIAKYKAITSFRTGLKEKKRLPTNSDAGLHLNDVPESRTPESSIISAETVSRLDKALDSLPARCRLVFQMVRLDKLRYKTVAEILGLSVKTVENHVAHAVSRLRKALTEE